MFATYVNDKMYINNSSNNVTQIFFGLNPLLIDKGEIELQWLDGQYVLTYPSSCRTSDGTNVSSSAYYTALNANKAVAAYGTSVTDTGTINGKVGAFHLEPVNKTAVYTAVEYTLPAIIECDGKLGEINAQLQGTYNAQKWNDGNYPLSRTTSQAINLTYTPESSISAEFTPPTISMTGPVNSDLLRVTSLVITTSGGTTVEIEWPDVDLVEYEQDGVWMRSHLQSISVADGVNQIDKCIRVRSSTAGSTTISVPVTMTIS